MKNVVLILAFLMLISCSKDNEPDNLTSRNLEFIMSKGYNRVQQNKMYVYDANNRLLRIDFNNTVNTVQSFIYDDNGILAQILEDPSPRAYLYENETIQRYGHGIFEVISFTDVEAHFKLSYYDDNAILEDSQSYEVKVGFDGNLIKSLYYFNLGSGDSPVTYSFSHDNDGKLLRLESDLLTPTANGFIGSTSTVDSWDDNEHPAKSQAYSFTVIRWLPNHYISFKNIKEISSLKRFETYTEERPKRKYEYEYDNNGMPSEIRTFFEDTEYNPGEFTTDFLSNNFEYIPIN